MSVQTAMQRIKDGDQIYVVEIDYAKRFPLSCYGPSLFHSNHTLNLLHPINHPPGVSATRDYSVCQLLIGQIDSYTHAHCDFFGFCGWLRLHSGRKLWVFAAPKHSARFKELFEGKLSLQHLTEADRASMDKMQVRAIVQEAGDTVWMPTGWVHFVLNLTQAIGYGGSILRKEGLKGMQEYIQSQKKKKDKKEMKETSKQLNLSAIMHSISTNNKHTQSHQATATSIIKLLK